MGKKYYGILLAVISAISFSACGQEESPSAAGAGEGVSEESAVEAGVGEGQPEESAVEAGAGEGQSEESASEAAKGKATGYEYDRESLTWELVWSDEFDYEGEPDPEKWGYDVGGNGWGNNELQYYTAGDNATVTDGCLVIEARKETMGAREYTSGRLVTRGKGDWLYGKVEICAKLPMGLGTWPAAWMLPTDKKYGQWPSSGEIDIMEHVGYDQDVIVHSVHNKKFNGGQSKGVSYRLEGVSEDFHVYALEWLPDKLIFSTDGVERYTYDPLKFSQSPDYDLWPFDQKMHILLNLAFGGNWGGARGTDDSYFPVSYYIDYVRVYQSPEIEELIGAAEE